VLNNAFIVGRKEGQLSSFGPRRSKQFMNGLEDLRSSGTLEKKRKTKVEQRQVNLWVVAAGAVIRGP